MHSTCVATGISVTCSNAFYLHFCMEHADATFSAVECVLTFLVLCVFRSFVSCVVMNVLQVDSVLYVVIGVCVCCCLVFNSSSVANIRLCIYGHI